MTRPLLALTLWPEWAWAITTLDKRIENRTWTPRAGQLRPGEWFAIHAGAHVGGRPGRPADKEGLFAVANMAERARWHVKVGVGALKGPGISVHRQSDGDSHLIAASQIPTSRVVALARYGGVRPSSSGWAVPGARHWHLDEVIPLADTPRMGGVQGLWPLPAAHARELLEMVRKAAVPRCLVRVGE